MGGEGSGVVKGGEGQGRGGNVGETAQVTGASGIEWGNGWEGSWPIVSELWDGGWVRSIQNLDRAHSPGKLLANRERSWAAKGTPMEGTGREQAFREGSYPSSPDQWGRTSLMPWCPFQDTGILLMNTFQTALARPSFGQHWVPVMGPSHFTRVWERRVHGGLGYARVLEL